MERQIRNLQIDWGAEDRVTKLLTPDQLEKWHEENALGIPSSVGTGYFALDRKDAERNLLRGWKFRFKLTDQQEPFARHAAKAYIQELEKFYQESVQKGSREGRPRGDTFGAIVRTIRAQYAALKLLEPSMTPEQRSTLEREGVERYFLYQPRKR